MIVWMVWFLSKFSWVSIILLGIYLPHGILFWISRDFGQHPQLRNSQFHGFGEASPPEKKVNANASQTSKCLKQKLETNTAPVNGWLEDLFPFEKANFQGLC